MTNEDKKFWAEFLGYSWHADYSPPIWEGFKKRNMLIHLSDFHPDSIKHHFPDVFNQLTDDKQEELRWRCMQQGKSFAWIILNRTPIVLEAIKQVLTEDVKS